MNNDQRGLFANRGLFNTPVGGRTFLTLMMRALGDSTLVRDRRTQTRRISELSERL